MLFFTVLGSEFGAQALSTVCDDDILNIARDASDAMHVLYEKTHKSLYGFILSITKDPHDAEDALQEAYISVYRSAHTYTPAGKPMAWLFTVARNAANMQLRTKREHLPFEEAFMDKEALFEDHAANERLALQAAMEQLSDTERQIIMLHAVSGLKNREIAKVLQIPLNTVLSKYSRALKKLRAYLEQEEKYER